MNTVQFSIRRKAAFAGALLTYRLYINGSFVGTLKNGQTLMASVPQAEVYYIDVDYPFDRNAVLDVQGATDVSIFLKRAGGWRTDSYNEFYLDTENGLHQLPSFHFERFANAVYGDKLDTLDADERVLALYVLNFGMPFLSQWMKCWPQKTITKSFTRCTGSVHFSTSSYWNASAKYYFPTLTCL